MKELLMKLIPSFNDKEIEDQKKRFSTMSIVNYLYIYILLLSKTDEISSLVVP